MEIIYNKRLKCNFNDGVKLKWNLSYLITHKGHKYFNNEHKIIPSLIMCGASDFRCCPLVKGHLKDRGHLIYKC